MNGNDVSPSAISGLEPTAPSSEGEQIQYSNSVNQPVCQKQPLPETIDMENIYRDLFNRVRHYDPPQDSQGDSQTGTEGAPTRVANAFWDFANRALRLAVETETNEVISALQGAYWTAVHASGRGSYRPSTVFRSTEDEKQCHARASILMSAMSGPSGPPTSYHIMHAIAVRWERYHHIAVAHGWKTLSILLYSQHFRLLAETAAQPHWERLLACIAENVMSLQLLGSFYCQGWEEAIGKALPEGVDPLTEDEKKRYPGHYHNWRVPLDKSARVFEAQHPPFNVIESSNWRSLFAQDPRKFEPAFAFGPEKPCNVCARPSAECECSLEHWFPARVELVETPNMGTGVRALQRFKKDQLLGEYVGDIFFGEQSEEDVYTLDGHLEDEYTITARYNGNWTRFINHSCDPSGYFDTVEHRGKSLTVYCLERDIQMFEELTVDYGSEYFIDRGLKCLCNATQHIHPLMG